ncbi:MAG: TonB-dependent receptor plug domain-containing protein, partial [Cyclobacteriaceae bacterium]|nr:TonB-dependent receptor plug domain-containing protein [Cyclobacteriaceae bacterium]
MKFTLFGSLLMLFNFTVLLAQDITVTGTVTGSEDGNPLPGVNVIISGTATGSVTDVNGQYSLTVPGSETTLVFSYVGYTTEQVLVGNQTVIDLVLQQDLRQLSEVVVTSFGIEKEKREITYAAQNVDADEIAKAREPNILNSLQGKVAGVDVIKSSAGVGGASRITIRGNRSVAGNNQPLYIVDGVPINNTSWSVPDNDNGGVQGGDGIGNINPDDIKSLTVLKGPNATALYGSRAANGAIVIATKQGVARQGIGVEFNTNISMDKALILTKFQNEYGQGNGGQYIKTSEHGWGAKMEGQMVETWSKDPADAGETYAYSPHENFKEFFQTGYNFANTLTLTAGNE